MALVRIDSAVQNSIHGSAQITADNFGQIYTTFQPYDSFWGSVGDITQGHIRWPGGSLAENKGGQDKYHLTNRDVYSQNAADKGLNNMLEQSAEADLSMSMILPTKPYFQEGNDTNFVNDLGTFYDRLTQTDGYYDNAQNFLATDNELMLEIGNETWQLGFGDWSYGSLAYAALETAADHPEISENDNIKFAVQTGSVTDHTGLFSTELIINNLDGATSNQTGGSNFANQDNVLDQIDALVNHDGLVSQAQDFSFENEVAILDEWKFAMGDHWEDVDLFASAWGVGHHSDGYDELQAVDPDVLSATDIGARQGAGTLDVFAKMSALGYDSASLWGAVDPEVNASSYLRENPDGAGDGFRWVDAELSHGGEVLRLMSESLEGTEMLAGNVDARSGEWDASYFDWDTKSGDGAINSYSFADPDKFVVFASVTDLDGQRFSHGVPNSGAVEHRFDVSDLHDVDFVTAEAVKTSFDYDGWRAFRVENPDISGPDLQSYRRLFESPEIHRETIEVREDGTFDYSFTDDFEVVRFVGDTSSTKVEPSAHEGAQFTEIAALYEEEETVQSAEPAMVEASEREEAAAPTETPAPAAMAAPANNTGQNNEAVMLQEPTPNAAPSEKVELAEKAECGLLPKVPEETVVESFQYGDEELELEGIIFGHEPGQTDPKDFLAKNGEIDGCDLVIQVDIETIVRVSNVMPADEMPNFPEDLSGVLGLVDAAGNPVPNAAQQQTVNGSEENGEEGADQGSEDCLDLGDGMKIKFLEESECEFNTCEDHKWQDDDEQPEQFDDALACLGFLF